jgi:hypothetical protein
LERGAKALLSHGDGGCIITVLQRVVTTTNVIKCRRSSGLERVMVDTSMSEE